MNIAIDVRRMADFGVGTYIRNLVLTLSRKDAHNRYLLMGDPAAVRDLGEMPPNFLPVAYTREDVSLANHFRFPLLLREQRVDVLHVPSRHVPLYVPCRYVVTVHDLADFLFPSDNGTMHSVRP